MHLHADALLAILGMALVTFMLRAGGLLMAERLPRRGAWERALNSLPGAVLVAIVIPDVIRSGLLGMAAASAVAVVAVRTRNLLAAMAIGVVSVALGRLLGLG